MIYGFLAIMCVIFIELVFVLDLRKQFKSSMSLSKEALDVIGSSSLDDSEKEIAMRRSSLAILKETLLFTAKFLLIFIMLYFFYYLVIHFSPVTENELINTMLSPIILVAMTIGSMIYIWVRNVISR